MLEDQRGVHIVRSARRSIATSTIPDDDAVAFDICTTLIPTRDNFGDAAGMVVGSM